MPDDPPRFGNASESSLEPGEYRDLILAVLTIQRQYHELYGTWLKVQDVEAYLKGERSL